MVETVAVAALISLILVLSLGLIPSFKLSNRKAHLKLQAGRLAQSALDNERSKPFAEVVSKASETTTVDEQPYEVEVTVSPGDQPDTTKIVRATVSWQWKGARNEVFRETRLVNVPR